MSYGSEKDNRAPTFDMDLSDFVDSNGDPISYEAARQYFEQDSSQKYVAKHFPLSRAHYNGHSAYNFFGNVNIFYIVHNNNDLKFNIFAALLVKSFPGTLHILVGLAVQEIPMRQTNNLPEYN